MSEAAATPKKYHRLVRTYYQARVIAFAAHVHADRDEEDGAENVAHALERPLHLLAMRRLGHDRPEKKCAERERVARRGRDDGEPEQQRGDP